MSLYCYNKFIYRKPYMSSIFEMIDKQFRHKKFFNAFSLEEIKAIKNQTGNILENKKEDNDDYLLRSVMNNETDMRSSFESKVVDHCFYRSVGKYDFNDEKAKLSDLYNTFNAAFTATRSLIRFYRPLPETTKQLFELTVQEIFSAGTRLNIDNDALALRLYAEICHSSQKDYLSHYIRENFVKSDVLYRNRSVKDVGENNFEINNALYIAAYNNEIAGIEEFYQKEHVNKQSIDWLFDFDKNTFKINELSKNENIDIDNLFHADVAVLLALAALDKHYTFDKKICNESFSLFKKMGFDFTEEKEAILILNAFNHAASHLEAFVDFNWNALDNKPLIKLIEKNKYKKTQCAIINVFKEKQASIGDYLNSVSQDTYNTHLSSMITATLQSNCLREDIVNLLRNYYTSQDKKNITNNREAVEDFFNFLLEPFTLIAQISPDKWQNFASDFNCIMSEKLKQQMENISENMLSHVKEYNLNTRVKEEKNIIDVSLLFKETIDTVLLKKSIFSHEPFIPKRI